MTGEFFAMRAGAIQSLGLMMLALASAPGAVRAQESASASPQESPQESADAEIAPLPDDAAMLGNALMFDPSALAGARPAKPLRVPSASIQPNLDIKTTEKPDGSSAVALKQPLPYDANVGADLGFAASSAPPIYQPGRPLPGSRAEHSSGAAWASVGVLLNFATLDARVDPNKDEGKLGTTFKHSIPVGSQFSVTLQNSYSVTETFSASSAGPADLPLIAAPPPSAPVPQIWGNEKAAKFDILSTGTTFGAKLATTSIDPVTHNTLSAAQKIYGPLQVTTAVTDVGQPTASKSIGARLKLNW